MEVDQFIHDSGLDLPRVGQVGIITPGIQDALPGFAAAFNLRTWYEPQYAEKHFFIDGQEVELDFNLVFAYSGGLQIELIEENSQKALIFKDHLDQQGQGIHHLGFFVADIDAKLKRANQLGLEILLEGQFKTAGGGSVRFVYLDTRQQCGIILELINIKLYGVNIPQTELMINVGRLTRDVVRFKV
jgi:catechol 2,3-dioxygenase-like lactoylglutathione lyase family enzyme